MRRCKMTKSTNILSVLALSLLTSSAFAADSMLDLSGRQNYKELSKKAIGQGTKEKVDSSYKETHLRSIAEFLHFIPTQNSNTGAIIFDTLGVYQTKNGF